MSVQVSYLCADDGKLRVIKMTNTTESTALDRTKTNEIEYLVTTRLEVLQAYIDRGYQIFMVDGTVPGFKPREGVDYHFDHHRPGGAAIQIDEMFKLPSQRCFLEESKLIDTEYDHGIPPQLIVTTQLDADACVAAAWLQLSEDLLTYNLQRDYELGTTDAIWNARQQRLRAIAYDCDHLCVPLELVEYADFAAKSVAAMKVGNESIVADLNLPEDRKQWSIEQKEAHNSAIFEARTQQLLLAAKGFIPFPGESGEADGYFEQMRLDTQMLLDENRVTFYKSCALIDYKGLQGRYIDPRCALKAIKHLEEEFANEYPQCEEYLADSPVTLAQREVYVDNEFKGYSYTLGIIPLHPGLAKLDYIKGVFDALTKAEWERNGYHYDASIQKLLSKEEFEHLTLKDRLDLVREHKLGWGGRKTVGGSSWNTPSGLTPEEVIDTVLDALDW